MTSDLLNAAREEAVRRFPELSPGSANYTANARRHFLMGATWAAEQARLQPAPHLHYAKDLPSAVDARETPPGPVCSGHRPVQHRDGKPPWCNSCGHGRPPITSTESLLADIVSRVDSESLSFSPVGPYLGEQVAALVREVLHERTPR